MADPLSVIASTVSIADVCVRLAGYLRDVQKGSKGIKDEIEALLHEVEGFSAINTLVQSSFEELAPSSPESSPGSSPSRERPASRQSHSHILWGRVKLILGDSCKATKRLESLVQDIYGKTGPCVQGKFDALKKSHRKTSKNEELRECRDQLTKYQIQLQLLLEFINLHTSKDSHKATARSVEGISKDLKGLDRRLKSQIEEVQRSIDSSLKPRRRDTLVLNALVELRQDPVDPSEGVRNLNHHFDIPQPVSNMYTGRQDKLEELRSIFFPDPRSPGSTLQSRFVIHGIGGAGKTQFCSKFAQDNRESFWGIFCIDASTTERIEETYKKISNIGGVDRIPDAAMHWLSNLKEKWLLIIDNADDPRLDIERYFPKGDRGRILITTRNPAFVIHGNVGPGHFKFEGLPFEEANSLLLKAASEPRPWRPGSEESASTITRTLGFLVLAIVQAGAVIRDGLCVLKDYLSFFERDWSRLRIQGVKDSNHHMYVYTTWQICYQRIEKKAMDGRVAARDALEILSIFSFMHWESIPHELFVRAYHIPVLEQQQQRTEAEEANKNKTIYQKQADLKLAARIYFREGPSSLRDDPKSLILPNIIREARSSGNVDEYEDRVKYALIELKQMSLIIENETNKTHYMHPIVHKWARERPGISLAEQALWAESAAVMIASSVLLPPLRHDTDDEDYTRELFSHVDHVQSCRTMVNKQLEKNRKRRWLPWLTAKSDISRHRVTVKAKFGLVYFHTASWKSAESMFLEVRNYLAEMLGPSHPRTRRVNIVLAGIYLQMGNRGSDVEKLQRDVLRQCLQSLGPEHPDTLRAKLSLGTALFQLGRAGSRPLLEEAHLGLQKALGDDNGDTLDALDNLGRTIGRYWDNESLERAYAYHKTAIAGMEKLHGKDHERTMQAQENLVRITIALGGPRVEEVDVVMAGVVEGRRRKLGKEHPLTLHAMCSHALVKIALGELSAAESLVMTGLPIAIRNLTMEHVGTLWGRMTLGSIRIAQHRLDEAEEILFDVAARQNITLQDGTDVHPDRLGTLAELAKCYRLQGKFEASIVRCDEALKGYEARDHADHPLARNARVAKQRMTDHIKAIQEGGIGDPKVGRPLEGGYRMYEVL